MTDMFREALATDPEGFTAIVNMAQLVWEPAELVRWMETPQTRWQGKCPLDLVADDKADDVLDLLETFEVR